MPVRITTRSISRQRIRRGERPVDACSEASKRSQQPHLQPRAAFRAGDALLQVTLHCATDEWLLHPRAVAEGREGQGEEEGAVPGGRRGAGEPRFQASFAEAA
jgi:hypothetical protein